MERCDEGGPAIRVVNEQRHRSVDEDRVVDEIVRDAGTGRCSREIEVLDAGIDLRLQRDAIPRQNRSVELRILLRPRRPDRLAVICEDQKHEEECKCGAFQGGLQ